MTNGLNSFLVYLDGLAHKCPGIKILEIGADTGGVTGHVLHTLTNYGEHGSNVPRFGHYAYTDISPSFENAKSMFKAYKDKVTSRTLDIERDPTHQGFEEARGGKIALFELTEPDALKTNFAFGLLPGWWRAADEYRGLSAGVTEKVWHESLIKAGFSGIELSLPDYNYQECYEHSVLVSTALERSSAQQIIPETLISLANAPPCNLKLELNSKTYSRDGSPAVHGLPLKEAASRPNTAQMFCVSLLEAEDSVLRDPDEEISVAGQTILTTMEGNIWITRGGGQTPALPDHALMDGLLRTVRQENIQAKFVTICFEPGNSIPSHLDPQATESKPFGSGPPLVLSISSPGLLDTLEFTEDKDSTKPLGPDEIEIQAVYSLLVWALNALELVCANASGTYQTLARCKAVHAIPLPEQISFLEGAALPLVFTTAYYALHYVAKIKDGESILIHSGAGGTGQAAIQIAKLFHADIYVTVGSEGKRKLLIEHYGIPYDHIFYSGNASFAQGIKRMTRNRGGVDFALNSLSGDALVATWQCIAPFGRFLELGKKDILSNGSLPMLQFAENVSFHAIDLNEAREHRPELWLNIKHGLMALIFGGQIKPPQPLHLYGTGDGETAFRYLQSGKNTGKTVIEMRPEDSITVNNPQVNFRHDIAGAIRLFLA
ncbi:hypothetical protein MMC30_009145 [Trapelia coarctata]|nr:hypothetical protein [Trapelia coarctata]